MNVRAAHESTSSSGTCMRRLLGDVTLQAGVQRIIEDHSSGKWMLCRLCFSLLGPLAIYNIQA